MSKVFRVLIVIIFIAALLFIMRDFIVKSFLSMWVKAKTGMSLQIDKLHIGMFDTLINIEGVRLYDPKIIDKDKNVIDIPKIYVDYELSELLKGDIHITELKFYLRKLVIEKDKEGVINLVRVMEIFAGKEKKKEKKSILKKKREEPPVSHQKGRFKIDLLDLKIGKLLYRDYSSGRNPSVKTFDIDIEAEYRDITDLSILIDIIVGRAVMNTGVRNIMKGLPLGDTAADIILGVTGIAAEGVKGALDVTTGVISGAADTLKKLVPLGGE